MQVSVQDVGGLEKKLLIEIPADQIEPSYEKKLKEVATKVRIDGFRPGKAPNQVVATRYGKAIRGEIVGDIIRDTLTKAFKEHTIEPATRPEVKILKDETGQALQYEAIFEVYPTIEIKDFNGLEVEKYTSTVTDTDIETTLNSLREQHMSWLEVKRPAQLKDRVLIDFVGRHNGEIFEGGSAEDVHLILGSNSFIDGFEAGLVGVNVGDTKILNVTFPEKYHVAKLAGQPAEFTVKVKGVEAPELPALDNDLAERFGFKEGGIDKLKTEVKENMERELEQALRTQIKDTVLNKLIAMHPDVVAPKGMIAEEIEVLKKEFLYRLRKMGVQANTYIPDDSQFTEQAKRKVILGLLLSELIKKFEVKVDRVRLRQRVGEIAAYYENPDEMVNWYYSDRRRLAEVEAVVMEEQIVDKLLEIAQVKEKPVSYKEALARAQNRDSALNSEMDKQ